MVRGVVDCVGVVAGLIVSELAESSEPVPRWVTIGVVCRGSAMEVLVAAARWGPLEVDTE